MHLTFEKYHGLGNDYLVYDCVKQEVELNSRAVRLVCDRNFGLGSDGILVGPVYKEGKISVRIYNPDGSIAENSGSGVRIFAKYLKDAGYIQKKEFTLRTDGGDVKVTFLNEEGTSMKVSMGTLSFDCRDVGAVGLGDEAVSVPLLFGDREYTATCVSIGNPHCVIPLQEVSRVKVCDIGRYSEHACYFPNKINTEIVRILDRNNVQMEVFERGAGYTLASGSSSCAVVGALYRMGLVDNQVYVRTPGGEVCVKIGEDWKAYLTGPVHHIGRLILFDEFIVNHKMFVPDSGAAM